MLRKGFNWLKCRPKAFAAWVQTNPIESILFVKAFALMLYAGYYMLPISLGAPGVLNTAFETPTAHMVIGLTLLIPALYTLAAIARKNLAQMHAGAFAVMMSWNFLLILRFAIFGFASASGWILLLAPAATTLLLYLALGKMLLKK